MRQRKLTGLLWARRDRKLRYEANDDNRQPDCGTRRVLWAALRGQARSNRESTEVMKPQLKKEITMKVIYFITGLSLSVLLSACAAVRGGGDVDRGRQCTTSGQL